MDSDVSEDEGPGVELINSIDLSSVLKGQSFEINFEKLQQQYEEAYAPRESDLDDLLSNELTLHSDDEDADLTSISFEELAERMIDITPDGKVKKKKKRKGDGPFPPKDATVYINYSSYLEYNDEPIDFAFIKKPFHFRLGSAAIQGLNAAVETMQVGEKAMFLVHHSYAFGKYGHPPRIPPEATFVFIVELLRFINSGPVYEFNRLTDEDKKLFSVAYKTAMGFIETGREHFKYNFRLSIRDYNRAVTLLEECHLADIAEQEKQQKLLLKLYTNLAVCYTKIGNAKKACCMCNNIYNMTRNTSLEVPAKVYYQNGRALLMLGEYRLAKDRLLKAKSIEPENEEISKQLSILNEKMQKDAERERDFAKSVFKAKEESNTNLNVQDEPDAFQIEMHKLCEELLHNEKQTRFRLPNGLTTEELEIVRVETKKLGLAFVEFKDENNGELLLYISKKSTDK